MSPSSARRAQPRRRLALLALLWLAVLVAAPLLGSHRLAPAALLGGGTDALILWQLRLPRVLLALAAGGVLAVAGAAFQTLFRNPLAEPYTLGVASGAALGAAIVFTEGGALAGWFPLVAAASFLGALAATALVLALGRGDPGAGAGRLLLAGVAVALSCQALILFLQYLAGTAETLRMVRWMMGGLGVVGYREVLWMLPWLALAGGVVLAARAGLDLWLAGEEIAAARGVDAGALRRRLLLALSLAVGALVAVAGPIGFVGLMVPHMLRRFVGVEHAALIPACLLGGGAFLALCDLAARTVLAPAELPVGVLTALLGGPFFLWLLARRP